MPQKTPTKKQMRLVFKRILDEADYTKLAHFVFLDKPFKEQIPGTYSVYHMVEGGIIIATNALCINEWLRLHGLPVRKELSEYTVNKKIKNNRTVDIDTRTPVSVGMRNTRGDALNPEDCSITKNVWQWYNAGIGASEISKRINCTPANVYYYIRKYKKLNPEWEKEVDI